MTTQPMPRGLDDLFGAFNRIVDASINAYDGYTKVRTQRDVALEQARAPQARDTFIGGNPWLSKQLTGDSTRLMITVSVLSVVGYLAYRALR